MSTPWRRAAWRMFSSGRAVTARPLSMNSTACGPVSLVSIAVMSASPSRNCPGPMRPTSAARTLGSSFDLVAEMLDHAADRIGRRLAEAADRGIGHGLRQFFEQPLVPARRREQSGGFLGADPAGRALAAGFVGEEAHDVQRRVAGPVMLR